MAQENYEIQVYASPTMAKGTTIFELHNNYTFNGRTDVVDGVLPSNHAYHLTLEITHGITKNFEVGFYLFTNYTSPYGFKVVGTHIRPRVSAPESWGIPVGLSLSAEIGYQRSEYSDETWSMEIRPIIDKQIGKLYVSFNPTLGIQLKGVNSQSAPAFAPNIKVALTVAQWLSLGTEYYGDLGPLNNFDNASEQNHALYAVADLFVDPKWEINFGPGWGLTTSTDKFLIKLLVGYRLQWTKNAKSWE